MPRSGDEITIGHSPTIFLSKYQSVKPTVSITRTLGDDPEADVTELVEDVKRQVHRAVLDQLGMLGEYYQVLEDGDEDALAEYCLEHSGAKPARKKVKRK